LELLGMIYLLWSCFHSFVIKANPDQEDFKGGIYEILLWGENPGVAIGMSIIALVLMIPLSALALWGMLLW
jgi:hypothetical protein